MSSSQQKKHAALTLERICEEGMVTIRKIDGQFRVSWVPLDTTENTVARSCNALGPDLIASIVQVGVMVG